MKGINQLPFVDCRQFINTDKLKEINLEICTGISLSTIRAGVYGPGVADSTTYGNFLDLKNKLQKDNTHGWNNLTHNQQNIFAKLFYGLYNPSTTVYLREVKKGVETFLAYKRKGYAEYYDWSDNIKHFPKLKIWLDDLIGPIFKEYGRILFFIHDHDCQLLLHRDGYHYAPHKNEFLWINPMQIKKFYIYDEENKTKHFVDSPAVFFNDLDMHGGESGNSMTWSLRIDGIFSDTFREKLGISMDTVY